MSGDYVSKATAINKIMENIVHQDSHDVNLHNIGLRKAMSVIDSLPAADVVEVVRCRDCKHNSTSSTRQFYQWCDEHHEYHVPDWFCADGERKDGGQDDV